jgi:hypothetical protein
LQCTVNQKLKELIEILPLLVVLVNIDAKSL